MAHPKNEWKETEIRRDDLKSMMTNTKKLIEMYSELLKVKRWENILEAQLKREEQEQKEQSGGVETISNCSSRRDSSSS